MLILHVDEQINEFIKICYRHDSIENLLANKLIREDMRSPGKSCYHGNNTVYLLQVIQ